MWAKREYAINKNNGMNEIVCMLLYTHTHTISKDIVPTFECIFQWIKIEIKRGISSPPQQQQNMETFK